MTATPGQDIRLPARPLVRILWSAHRALYRMTGGRFGLAEPKPGTKLGILRLHSVGRRTGKARVAIVGYYEDGANLVTLAMNGWGHAEPGWWLNLQTMPDATVDLVGGSRPVRARAAIDDERERLWKTFDDYPGWGDDLDGLAARRIQPTSVVILEPRAAGTGPST